MQSRVVNMLMLPQNDLSKPRQLHLPVMNIQLNMHLLLLNRCVDASACTVTMSQAELCMLHMLLCTMDYCSQIGKEPQSSLPFHQKPSQDPQIDGFINPMKLTPSSAV